MCGVFCRCLHLLTLSPQTKLDHCGPSKGSKLDHYETWGDAWAGGCVRYARSVQLGEGGMHKSGVTPHGNIKYVFGATGLYSQLCQTYISMVPIVPQVTGCAVRVCFVM